MIASVIIPTYNRSHSLRRVLQSLVDMDSPFQDYEVIVVDNNSKDDTPQAAEEFRCGKLNLTYVKETNLSFTVARHTGAKVAKTEILCYLDDDVVVDKKWLRSLVELLQSDTKIGMVAGRIEPIFEEDPPRWALVTQKRFNAWSLWHYAEKVCEAPGACGPNLIIRREVFDHVGGFPADTIGGESQLKPGTIEKIYIGPGDWGLNLKVRKAGYKIVYSPDVLVYHVIPHVRMTEAWWESRFVGEGYMLAITGQVWRPFPSWLLCLRVLLSFLLALAGRMVFLLLSVIRSDLRYYFKFASQAMMTKTRVVLALVKDPGLARRLWDTALKGIEPEEIEQFRKSLP
ncbi:MAG: glycosyltransferase [Candidatus Omnitrophica bacterium]|nr:glycosyltransferase [Candidatus Omnitrophota bacterium]